LKTILITLVVSLIASLITLAGYHFHLTRNRLLGPCIKGVYTVNLSETIEAVRTDLLRRAIKGEKTDPDEAVGRIQKALDTLSKNLPQGFLLVPESCVLAGRRKQVDLLKGAVKTENGAVNLAGKL